MLYGKCSTFPRRTKKAGDKSDPVGAAGNRKGAVAQMPSINLPDLGDSGGVTTSVITFCAKLAGDFTTPAGVATLGLLYEALGV